MKNNKIEDVWNGDAGGLVAEVVTHDIYRLKELKFIPEIFYDIGGNIGIVARFVRALFPDCLIISVEPNKENCEIYKHFTKDKNTILIEKALGNGKMWHGLTARNGSGETYLNSGIGFPEVDMDLDESLETSIVETVTLTDLIKEYRTSNQKFIVKIDCEGNEHTILFNDTEMNSLKMAEYICAEIHFYSHTGKEWQEVQDKTRMSLKSLEETHICELDNVNFWATKKEGWEVEHRLNLDKTLRYFGMVGDTIEIGVAEGNFSLDMLKWSMGKHYMVDNFGHIQNAKGDGGYTDTWHEENYKKTLDKIKPFGDRAIILKGLSIEMAQRVPDDSVVLINVDADHSFEGVMNDISIWWSKLKIGGIMAFHDFEQEHYGVKKAVTSFAETVGLEIHLLPENAKQDAGAWIQKK